MTKRRAYFLLTLLTMAILGILTFAYTNIDIGKILPAQVTQPSFYRVIDVVDGDTIAVDINGTTEKVRMLGVDTPETHKPGTPVQCFGPQASDFTTNLLSNRAVRLESDPINSDRDRYKRLLRYVYTEDGVLVSQKLIEEGYGFAYLSFPLQKADSFASSQDTARSANRGLWAACSPTMLKNGNWQSNPQTSLSVFPKTYAILTTR